jgi:VanZ family protein
MSGKKRAWAWPVLIAGTIFTLSGTSQLTTPDVGFRISTDKIGHFLVFGLLATSILRIPKLRRLGWRGAIIAAAATIAFGGFDEMRQSFTPGRSVEFADWLADALGAIVAVFSYRTLHSYRRLLEWQIWTDKKVDFGGTGRGGLKHCGVFVSRRSPKFFS